MNRLPTLGRIFAYPAVRRTCALALLLVVPWLAWIGLIAPSIAVISDTQMRISNDRALLARYRSLIAAMPDLEKEGAALLKPASSDHGFYQGLTSAMASARLQSDVQRLISASRVETKSSQTLPAGQEAGFDRAGLQLDLSADAEGLMRFLDAVERADPALFIDDLTVSVPTSGIASSNAAGQPLLNIRCRIFGYGRKGGA